MAYHSSRPSAVRFLVLAWLCGLATLAYIHRGCVSVPATLIQNDLCLTKREMAQIMFAFFLGYSLCQIPSGWLGDRFGTRHALTLMIILWSAATGWMGLMASFFGLWLARMLNGIAQAGIFPCSINSVSQWFPETGKAFPSGMLGSFMSVGAVIASALAGLLLHYLSWQEMFLALSLPGFVAAIGFVLWFRDRPAEHPKVNQAELDLIDHGKKEEDKESDPGKGLPLRQMATSFRLWMICLQQFGRAAGYIFFLTWFPTFLQETRGASVSESGYLTSLPLLGVVFGSGVGGALMDLIYLRTGSRSWSRKGVAVGSLLLCGGLIAVAYFARDPLVTSGILTAASFFAGLCGPAGYTVTMDVGGRHVATVFSTMNMVGNIGAALMPLLVVELVERTSWNDALLLLIGLYLLSAFCWLLLRVEGSIFEKASASETVP